MSKKIEQPLTAEEERELHRVYADVTAKSPLVYRHVQRLLAILHAERARYQEVLRWYNDALAAANEAGIHVHATAAEAMRMLAQERDAINEERRKLGI